jgi:hypothetical protein
MDSYLATVTKIIREQKKNIIALLYIFIRKKKEKKLNKINTK